MGECAASGTSVYQDGELSTLTIEFWDRDYPHEGEKPCINITAEDHQFDYVATAGLRFEQVRELRDTLTRWLDAGGQL